MTESRKTAERQTKPEGSKAKEAGSRRPTGRRPARTAAAAAAVAVVSMTAGCAGIDPTTGSVLGNENPGSTSAVAERPETPQESEGSMANEVSRGSEEVSQALQAAEQAYRDRRFDEALAAFRQLAEDEPANAHAWLRIGNVLHRRRDWFDALSAYRKAARPQAATAIREKAVYNIALLNLELARQAMKRLERIRDEAGASGLAERRRDASVGEAAITGLSTQIGTAYRDLSSTHPAERPTQHPAERVTQHPAERATQHPAQRSATPPVTRAARSGGPRLTPEKPVVVEIRQGGVGR